MQWLLSVYRVSISRLQRTVLQTSQLLLKLIFITPWDFGTRSFIITKRMQILGPTFHSLLLFPCPWFLKKCLYTIGTNYTCSVEEYRKQGYLRSSDTFSVYVYLRSQMTDIVSSLNVLYCSTLCIFIYIFGIWTNTGPVGMESRVLDGMAREAQDLMRLQAEMNRTL